MECHTHIATEIWKISHQLEIPIHHVSRISQSVRQDNVTEIDYMLQNSNKIHGYQLRRVVLHRFVIKCTQSLLASHFDLILIHCYTFQIKYLDSYFTHQRSH